jgi:2'-5' RNA ligase
VYDIVRDRARTATLLGKRRAAATPPVAPPVRPVEVAPKIPATKGQVATQSTTVEISPDGTLSVTQSRIEPVKPKVVEIPIPVIKLEKPSAQRAEAAEERAVPPPPAEERPRERKEASQVAPAPTAQPRPAPPHRPALAPPVSVRALREGEVGSVVVRVPPIVADMAKRFADQIPTGRLASKGVVRDPHITVKYGLLSSDPVEVQAAIGSPGHIRVRLGKTTVFENPDGDVLVVEALSPDLETMHARLGAIANVGDFPEYRPHMTIAYLAPGEGRRYVGDRAFEGIEFAASEVEFSPQEGAASISIPLDGGTPIESPIAGMRVEDEHGTRAVAGMDPRIMQVLGRNLYSGDLAKIAVKEMLQNAVDAVRALPNPSDGVVTVDIDTINQKIIVTDNGPGMPPEVATKELVDIGGSRKPAEGASGGFGIAKVAIFANAKTINVDTVADTPRGRIVTSLSGSGVDWADVTKGLKVESANAHGLETGTRISIKLSTEENFGGVKGFLSRFLALHRLPFTFRFFVNGQAVQPYDDYYIDHQNAVKKIETVNAPGAAIDFYVSDKSRREEAITVSVLNSGLPQFEKNIFLPSEVVMPRTVIADVRAKGSPEEPDYPFSPDRERLRGEADEAINDFVLKNLAAAAARRERRKLVDAIDSAPAVDGTKWKILDTTGEIPREVVEDLAKRSYLAGLSMILSDALDAMSRKLSSVIPKYGNVSFYGIALSPDYHGVNIQSGLVFEGERAKNNLVLINPFTIYAKAVSDAKDGNYPMDKAPEYLARRMAAVLIHEITHQIEGYHNEGFSSLLTENIAYLYDEKKGGRGGVGGLLHGR